VVFFYLAYTGNSRYYIVCQYRERKKPARNFMGAFSGPVWIVDFGYIAATRGKK
jgi:hypothetical protein